MVPPMMKKGLSLRPTFDQLVQYIEKNPDKIKPPDRSAKFERNSPLWMQLDGFNFDKIKEQQDIQMQMNMREHLMTQIARENGVPFHHLRAYEDDIMPIPTRHTGSDFATPVSETTRREHDALQEHYLVTEAHRLHRQNREASLDQQFRAIHVDTPQQRLFDDATLQQLHGSQNLVRRQMGEPGTPLSSTPSSVTAIEDRSSPGILQRALTRLYHEAPDHLRNARDAIGRFIGDWEHPPSPPRSHGVPVVHPELKSNRVA